MNSTLLVKVVSEVLMVVGLLCAILAVIIGHSIDWKDTELEDLSNSPRGERVFWGTAKLLLPVGIALGVVCVIALFS